MINDPLIITKFGVTGLWLSIYKDLNNDIFDAYEEAVLQLYYKDLSKGFVIVAAGMGCDLKDIQMAFIKAAEQLNPLMVVSPRAKFKDIIIDKVTVEPIAEEPNFPLSTTTIPFRFMPRLDWDINLFGFPLKSWAADHFDPPKAPKQIRYIDNNYRKVGNVIIKQPVCRSKYSYRRGQKRKF